MPVPLRPSAAFVAGRVLFPFACGYFLSYLFRSVNAVIAPNLQADLGIGAGDLGTLTAAYFVTFAAAQLPVGILLDRRSEEHTSELQSLMRISYAVFCLKKKK